MTWEGLARVNETRLLYMDGLNAPHMLLVSLQAMTHSQLQLLSSILLHVACALICEDGHWFNVINFTERERGCVRVCERMRVCVCVVHMSWACNECACVWRVYMYNWDCFGQWYTLKRFINLKYCKWDPNDRTAKVIDWWLLLLLVKVV